ncbi:uncharacterized protein J3D65DRAFT_567588 [Phyllosticta citribraziliensis]|uniref:ATP-dependent DNA helicase n=1 Tax=Phyllosticta citribraziliensis TaxID=989973 RepID=A0ABR1M2Q3_9PEZI
MPPRKKRTVTIPDSSDNESESRGGIGKLVIEPPKKPASKPRKRKADDDADAPKKPRGRPRKSVQNDVDSSPKPRRRARKSTVEDDEGSPPTTRKRRPRKGLEDDEAAESDNDKPSKKQKLKVHEPAHNVAFQDTYLTQLPRDQSPPWAIRPAVWQKQDLPPPPPPPKPMFQNFQPQQKAHLPPPPRQTLPTLVNRPGPAQTKSAKSPGSISDRSGASSPNSLYSLSPNLRPAGPSKSPQSLIPNRPASNVNVASKVSENQAERAPDPKPVQAEVDLENCPSSPPNIPKESEFDDFPSAIFDDDFEDECDTSRTTNAGNQMPPPAVPARTAKSPTQRASEGRSEAQDIEAELADLPSDAFSDSEFSFPDDPTGKAPAQAIEITSSQTALGPTPRRLVAPLNGLRQMTLFGNDAPVPQSQANKRYSYAREEPPTHHELDQEALETWVYPTNIGTIRDYQYNIVHRGLFHNLLVALPTGLGKTFIAATVMLNWLRWTKKAQVIFVAPTKPLVSQQVEACLNIAGISRSQTTLLTGDTSPALRQQEWETKRVFFMTPQTVVNDLAKGIADPKKIVLVVFDEAHRATGAYAYVEIVKFIRRFNTSFRILALTATPGATVEAVQKVIDSLEISKVEIRTENSLDIRQFVHSRHVEKSVLRENRDILVCSDLFSKAVQPVLDRLNQQNAYWSRDPMRLSLYGLTQARSEWARSQAGRNAPGPVKGLVNALFMALTSLARCVDLLKYHGIRPFYSLLKEFKKEATGNTKKQIVDHPSFTKLMDTLSHWTEDPEYMGHPKLEFLRERVMNHFLDSGEGTDASGSKTRIMVFAHWRDSAEDIVRVLKLSSPMIRPHVFVGQAATKTSEAMDQKKQLEVVQKFKAGEYNTLVATSIGEEGLDIGEVDLIVCYDSKASPIRMLQRMGRTGRKRQGNILLLMMAGKEEDDSEKAKDAYNKMQEKIANGDEFNFHTDLTRRIVPRGVDPRVDKRQVEIPIENSQPELPEPKKGGRAPKRQPKKFHMPDGVMDGFIKASTMNGGDVDELGNIRLQARKKKPAYVDPPEDRVPAEQVLLSQREERDLERQYQNVHDVDGDLEIPPLALNAHPASQRLLTTTKYVPSSRASREFVKTMNLVHEADRLRIEALRRNYHASNLDGWKSADEDNDVEVVATEDHEAPIRTITPARPRNRISDMVMEADESSPPPTDPRMRIGTQGINLGSDDTDGFDDPEDEQLDSELRSFVVDDNEEVQMFSSSLPGRSRQPVKLFSDSQDYDDNPRHNDNEEEDDDDLPDIGTLLKTPRQRLAKGPTTAKIARSSSTSEDDVVRQRQRRRLVVEDSETE